MPDPRSYDDLDHLRDAIERLTNHVELLTRAIDDLTTEIQWRNNEASTARTRKPLFDPRSSPEHADAC